MRDMNVVKKSLGEAANSLGTRIGALFGWRGFFGRRGAAESNGGDLRGGLVYPDAATDAVIEMAIDSWRFGRIFEKVASKLEGAERERCMNQLASFNKKIGNSLEALELRIVNIEGTPFDPGIAATPLNIEEFEADDELMIDRMIEPIIMGKDGLIRIGKVTLRKMER
jgi:hypothetical protein